jgi:hypothetical protein
MVQHVGSLRSSQGLQFPTATLRHFSGSLCQANKKGVHFLTDFGGGTKAEIRRHFFSHLLPDGLTRVEIRAVGWQCHLSPGRRRAATWGSTTTMPTGTPLIYNVFAFQILEN